MQLLPHSISGFIKKNMKKNYPYIFEYLLFLFIEIFPSQVIPQNSYIHTDRNCYVSGDRAFVKIYQPASVVRQTNEQTVCVDMLNAEGRFVQGELIKMQKGLASGYFSIPDTLATGAYQLRVYQQPDDPLEANPTLAIKYLFVSNRFGKNEPIYDSMLLPRESSSLLPDQGLQVCELQLSHDTLGIRKKMQMNLSLVPESVNTIYASVSVRPVSTKELEMEQRNVAKSTLQPSANTATRKVIPGIKIQGTLLTNSTKTPVTDAVVFLSFQDTLLRLKYDLVDHSGQFVFYLNNCFGMQTVYFSAYLYPSLEPLKDIKFQITDPFMASQLFAPGEVLCYEASSDTLNILKSVIAKAYNTSCFTEMDVPVRDSFSFEQNYLSGIMTNVVAPDDYVTLPDFEQIAIEILPFLRYKKWDGSWRISVIDGKNEVIRYNPLVFVDGVPLLEPQLLFSWGTSRIKKVEIKSQPRFFGDLYFEKGLVFIWTKEQNFWSQNSSSYIQEVELPFYQKPIQFIFPDYSKNTNFQQPDFRQTLYWEPNVELSSTKQSKLNFYTSDEKGDFEVEVEGITNKGQPVYFRKVFTVE
ncbi:MAG TPA: hypothetical protein DCY97_20225 [Marinilabiliales bacterium]|nr:hypothetical protein [Marinilabiliales bacterium]